MLEMNYVGDVVDRMKTDTWTGTFTGTLKLKSVETLKKLWNDRWQAWYNS